MKIVEDFVLSSTREERRAHLDLSTPCIERGGTSPTFKGLLATMLDTTIPTKGKVLLCHACNNGGCSNWLHLYWGTLSDNAQDYRAAPYYKTAWQRMVEKHGEDKARELMQKAGSSPRKSYGRYRSPPKPNGTCWVTDGVSPIRISKDLLDDHLQRGYRRGRK